MTKRTLFIIIGLLFFLDVAALIVYLVGNSNPDGKSPIEYVLRDSIVHEMADTIPDKLVVDQFDTISRSATFVSLDKMMVGNVSKPMTCTMKLKFVWPKSINGRDDVSSLHRELLSRLSRMGGDNVNTVINSLFEKPEFARRSLNFKKTTASVESPGINHTIQNYRIFPYFSTNYLLEMVVLVEKHNGATLSRSMNIVHYDRVHHNVITIDKIFDLSQVDKILALVNQKIESEKLEGTHVNWHETGVLPTEFLLGRKSVVFYLADGAIAPRGTGLHEVSVSNDDLEPFFTNYYNEMLVNDSHFVTYEFISL